MGLFVKRKKEKEFKDVVSNRDPNALKCLNPNAYCEAGVSNTSNGEGSYGGARVSDFGTMSEEGRIFSIGTDPFAKLHDKENTRYLLRKMRKAFSTLDPDEQSILSQRYGFCGEPKTFREISVYFEKTPQRIEQLQKAAESKLKNMINKSIK
jgi:hypothetical protein